MNVEVAYNSAVSSTTLCSPFFINYGIQPIVFLVETIDSYNPSASEFLKSTNEATELARKRIANQNEKRKSMLTDHGFIITIK